MKQKIAFCLICLVFCFMPQAVRAEITATCPISFNGETGKLTAFIQNETAYLPLRDTVELCCVTIDWDNTKKQAVVSTGLDDTVFKLAGGKWYLDGKEMNERRVPLIRNNQLYLPLYSIQKLCEVNVNWNKEQQRIDVYFPFVYTAGQWQYYNRTKYIPVKKSVGQESCYMITHMGEATTGTDYLWELKSNGQYRRLAADCQIADWQIKDGVCYYLAMQMGFGDKYCVYAVDLTDGKKTQLGNPDYVYHITVKKDGPLYVLTNYTNRPKDWRVESEGVLINGIAKAALSDDVVEDEELMQQTYGRYLLPLDGGEQTMLKALSE